MRTSLAAILAASLIAIAMAFAVSQSHPISQVDPVNVTFNMAQQGITNASSVNVTDSAGTPKVSLLPTGNIYASGNLTYSGRTFILDAMVINDTAGGLNVSVGNFSIVAGDLIVRDGRMCVGDGGCTFSANSEGVKGLLQIFDGGPQSPTPGFGNGSGQLYVDNNTGIGGGYLSVLGGEVFFLERQDGAGVNTSTSINGTPSLLAITHHTAIIVLRSDQNEDGEICLNPVNTSCTSDINNVNITTVQRGGLCITGSDGVCDNGNFARNTSLVIDDGSFCISKDDGTCGLPTKGHFIVANGSMCVGDGGCNTTDEQGTIAFNTRSPNATIHINGSVWTANGSRTFLITGRNGSVVGPTLRLDANTTGSAGGHQWDIISTGVLADVGAGALGFFDNTLNRYVLTLFGRDNTGRVRVNGTSIPTRALGITGSALATGGFATGGPDVAEAITVADPAIEAGDVLVAAGEVLAGKAMRPHDTRAIGIVSTDPGIELYPVESMDASRVLREDERLLALKGRVPVKVTDEAGPIRPGDLLATSSTPGHAMKLVLLPYTGKETPAELARKLNENERRRSAAIGKALEPHAAGRGKILTMVMLR